MSDLENIQGLPANIQIDDFTKEGDALTIRKIEGSKVTKDVQATTKKPVSGRHYKIELEGSKKKTYYISQEAFEDLGLAEGKAEITLTVGEQNRTRPRLKKEAKTVSDETIESGNYINITKARVGDSKKPHLKKFFSSIEKRLAGKPSKPKKPQAKPAPTTKTQPAKKAAKRPAPTFKPGMSTKQCHKKIIEANKTGGLTATQYKEFQSTFEKDFKQGKVSGDKTYAQKVIKYAEESHSARKKFDAQALRPQTAQANRIHREIAEAQGILKEKPGRKLTTEGKQKAEAFIAKKQEELKQITHPDLASIKWSARTMLNAMSEDLKQR